MNNNRRSSIELLKVLAILLVIINHVIQTLCESNEYLVYQNYLIDITHVTRSGQQLLLAMLRYSGAFGNTLFFVCSAFFFLEKKESDKKKIFHILADVYIFSIFFLAIVLMTNRDNIDSKLIIKECFPTIFANNWYVTCYILFCFLYPLLNKIIYSLSQRELLRISMVLALLYILMCYIKNGLFFSSHLILWVTIYFVIAYIKIFMTCFCENRRYNIVLVTCGFAGGCGIIVLTNLLGLRFSFFADKLTYWDNNCSPFLIMTAIGLLNIVCGSNWKNKWVNAISSCSLLIYIIHENLLMRIYYRPRLWRYVYVNFERENHRCVLVWTFLLTMVIFMSSLLISLLYKKFVQNRIYIFCDKIMHRIKRLYNRLEICLLRIK